MLGSPCFPPFSVAAPLVWPGFPTDWATLQSGTWHLASQRQKSHRNPLVNRTLALVGEEANCSWCSCCFSFFFFKPHRPNSCFPAAKVIFFVTTESCCYPTCNDETPPSLCQKRNRQHGQDPLKSPDDLFSLHLQTLTGRCVSRVARTANAVPCHSFSVTSL